MFRVSHKKHGGGISSGLSWGLNEAMCGEHRVGVRGCVITMVWPVVVMGGAAPQRLALSSARAVCQDSSRHGPCR